MVHVGNVAIGTSNSSPFKKEGASCIAHHLMELNLMLCMLCKLRVISQETNYCILGALGWELVIA